MNRVVSVILRGDVSGLVGSMRAASSSVGEAANRMTGASREAEGYRRNLSALGDTAGRIGLVAVGGLAAIIATTAKFDKQMSAVQAATHETADAMSDLRKAAIDAGADTAFSASEAAQGIEELAKAGISTKDILNGGLTGSLDLAAAGALDVGDAAEIAATAMTQFGLGGDKVGHVADLLSAGAGRAQGSVADLGAALNQSGLVASQTGLTIEETTGTLAAFASAGLLGSDSGTAFKTMLQSLTPTGKAASDEMTRLGISAYDVQGNFVGMTTFADSLRNGLKDLSVEQQNAALKTIFGSDAVRAASVVFEQGGEGIQSWIDKVNDSGFAAETAKTRLSNFSGDLEALKGSLETALIGAGEGSTGPLRKLTQGATDAINVFNELPGPLKATATGMLAITAVLGGGLWFTAKTVAGVAAMRASLATLGATSAATSVALTALGRGVAGVTAVWAGAGLGDMVGDRDTKEIDKLGASLKDFAKTGKATGDLKKFFGEDLRGDAIKFGKDLGSIGEALKSLDGYADDNSVTELGKFIGSAGQSAGITAQAEALGDLDTALGRMASKSPEQAIAAFEKLRDRAMETGASAKDVAKAFPQMAETLAAASQAMGGSGDASEALTGDLSKLSPAAAGAAEEIKAATEALDKARESALSTSLSFFDFSRDAKQSFGDYLDQLEKSAEAYRDFTQNALTASDKGLDGGLIEQLKQQGPEGALALADFADASEKEIKRANDAFRDTSGLSELEAELSLLPPDVITEFKTAGAPDAIEQAAEVAKKYKMSPKLVETLLKAKDYTKADIKAVLARLAQLDATTANPTITVSGAGVAVGAINSVKLGMLGLKDKTVTIYTQNKTKKAEGGEAGLGLRAQGPVTGPGTGTSDSIPALLSNGEHVLTAAEVQKAGGQGAIYRLRAAIRGGSLPAFASGGAVEGPSPLELKQQEKTVRDIERSLAEREKFGKKPKKGRDTRPSRNVLRGLDRQIALLELAEAKQDLRDLKSGKESRLDAREKAKQDALDAANDAESSRLSAKGSYTQNFKLGNSLTAASLERNLDRTIADSAVFLGLLGDLKAQGASPWLLAQLVDAGPTKSAIRLAREYATNSTKLASINAKAGQIDSLTNSYASLVGNAAFMSPAAWNSGVNSQTVIKYEITAMDRSAIASEVVRYTRQETAMQAQGAGV